MDARPLADATARHPVARHVTTQQLTTRQLTTGALTMRLSLVVAAVLAAMTLVAPPSNAATTATSAQTLLNQLAVASESSGGSYDRDDFEHWSDADGDGCDTRAEVLKEESTSGTSQSGTCTITSGRWVSDYDGLVLTDASDLDIDHMVPLKEAWISGAASWSASQREAFANDLAYAPSLVAVSASSNRSKSDRDPDAWLPSRATCDYTKRWIAVKWRWSLRIDSAEKSAVQSQLDGCSSLSVPTPSKT